MSQATNSYFSVHFVGNGEFSFFKYGNRAYRLMNIEAGHCSQNLYLVSTVLGVECAASGAFLDDEFFDFLKIPHKNRFLLYENFVGEWFLSFFQSSVSVVFHSKWMGGDS